MFGRPCAAASIHVCVCVCCKIKSTQGCTQGRHVTRVHRPGAAASLHILAAQFLQFKLGTQGCTHGKATRIQSSAAVSARTHTHRHVCMCCRKINSGLVLPTRPCCENTYVCCSIGQTKVASKDQDLADQGLLRQYTCVTCVSQNK